MESSSEVVVFGTLPAVIYVAAWAVAVVFAVRMVRNGGAGLSDSCLSGCP